MNTSSLDLASFDEVVRSPSVVTDDVAPSAKLMADFERACLNERQFDALEIPPRRALIGDWFCESDLGFIYAKRGTGKTWFALALARALADGTDFGPWKKGAAVKVLYIDGEMHLEDMRKRNQSLRNDVGENLVFLSHQRTFDVAKANLGLSDPAVQSAITGLCAKLEIKVLCLDNLSTLFSGVEENKADAWRDYVEFWLLELRRCGIAVVIIAHAGRNGLMRGTSKREDCAFWQICLDPIEDAGGGTHFVSRFTKNRNASQDPPPLNWHFTPDENRVKIAFTEADSLQIFLGWIADGLTSCSDIAEGMGLSKGQVSKLATKAVREGLIKKHGREYELLERRE